MFKKFNNLFPGYNKLLTDIQIGVKDVLATGLPKEIQIYNRYIKYITAMDYTIGIPFLVTVFSLSAEGVYFLIYRLDHWKRQYQVY